MTTTTNFSGIVNAFRTIAANDLIDTRCPLGSFERGCNLAVRAFRTFDRSDIWIAECEIEKTADDTEAFWAGWNSCLLEVTAREG